MSSHYLHEPSLSVIPNLVFSNLGMFLELDPPAFSFIFLRTPHSKKQAKRAVYEVPRKTTTRFVAVVGVSSHKQ